MTTDFAYIKTIQQRIANNNDMKAYEALYKLLFPSLFRFSFSFVKSHEAAEEIVSDTFIKVWQQAAQLNHIHNLKAYLFTLTKNLSINYVTRCDKHILYTIDDFTYDHSITWQHPEDIFISGEAIRKINQAIHSLPSQCRIIFQLVKLEGLTYQEAADVLGLSLPTVRNQVTIGMKKLLQSLPAFQFTVPV
ncbi:RNA polymerase sigma-70 factor, ECF subfamily [Filimonas lacunae]|uniref:RNA polymerase sigma-70 factor, ECF subfamily n=1 Tax=Filimonas lacunae TaxID=477680 RepID=A0A173MGZ9_9BACT|nr:RNA polymerase sigma-70 factor [Filimonas lacunae]BAV06769.1 RNA polymerase ECF-type sigma factor [Filimonas lacunae]SIT34389.1 RNA polymerase sigma-70 factor, ECF subfamily [Filimonas lacunae]